MKKFANIHPWAWVPTLYFIEGIPYFIVNTISVIIFKDMGMDNGTLALLTSLIGLPWVIKPLWSPFVDIFRSKRWWIVLTQCIMAASVLLLAFLLPHPTAQQIASGSLPISEFTLMLIFFVIIAFASATHDISADGFYMIAQDTKSQAFFLGIRNTFYRIGMVFGQGVLVVLAGVLEKHYGDMPRAWSITLIITSLILTAIALYHIILLPRPSQDGSSSRKSGRQVLNEFGSAFASFFTKPGIIGAMAFMLLYRLPEALSVTMLYPFFSDPVSAGGLGFGKEAFGTLYGTCGVIALLAGGILGGMDLSKRGLNRCFMPMALSLALPCAVYLFMALAQPSSLWVIGGCIVLDQFGYGYGFTAYTMFMMRFADGPLKTSHYAICTGFMALSMKLPGAVAGYLQEALGYTGFFILIMICCIATISVTLYARRRFS